MKYITLTIKVPDDYKYMATQPWGEVTVFKEKPEIVEAGNEKYWDLQDGEISLLADGVEVHALNEWQDSLMLI